jgi:hypothetical protein
MARGGDEARIIQRFKRLGPQRKALAFALTPYLGSDGRIDPDRWERAFVSSDPETIANMASVNGTFGGLVNHCVEMLQTGARLAGLQVAQREEKPSAAAVIDAVKDDGGLTLNQAEVLTRLNRTRNDLEHDSPGVQADVARTDVEALIKVLPGLVKKYLSWLARHDIHILPRDASR